MAAAVARAHADVAGNRTAVLASGLLEKDAANINRSPTSYLLNPEDERNFYEDAGGVSDQRFFASLLPSTKASDFPTISTPIDL